MRTRWFRHLLSTMILASLFPVHDARAAALLPLAAEESATLPSGTAEIVLGASYFNGLRFPNFRQELGNAGRQSLLAVPQIAFRIAAGDWAEIQASHELLLLEETRVGSGDDSEYGTGDARMFTKVSVMAEAEDRPGAGLRFGTKLPNANVHDHLGTDEIDFFADVLLSKDVGPADVHANLGLHLLGNPGPSRGQDDLFSYTIAVASHPLVAAEGDRVAFRLVAEISGLAGSRFDNDRASLRGGFQFRSAVMTIFGGAGTGLMRESEDIAFTGGLMWTWEP